MWMKAVFDHEFSARTLLRATQGGHGTAGARETRVAGEHRTLKGYGMGKQSTQKSKTTATRERQVRASRRRLVVSGLVCAVVLAGFVTWYFYPRPSLLSAAAPYQGGPRLAVDTELIDFGPVRFNKMVQARFLLRNVGDQPLRIAANPPVEAVEGC